jgi:hypothetical protein
LVFCSNEVQILLVGCCISRVCICYRSVLSLSEFRRCSCSQDASKSPPFFIRVAWTCLIRVVCLPAFVVRCRPTPCFSDDSRLVFFSRLDSSSFHTHTRLTSRLPTRNDDSPKSSLCFRLLLQGWHSPMWQVQGHLLLQQELPEGPLDQAQEALLCSHAFA